MTATTLADLVDLGTISTDRLRAALQGQPALLAACTAARPVVELGALAAAVRQALPDALDVDIGSVLLRRWWPRHQGPRQWSAELALNTLAELELPERVAPPRVLRVRADVLLTQDRSRIVLDPAGPALLLGEPRSWRARWHILLWSHPDGPPQPVAEGWRDVWLKLQQLPLPPPMPTRTLP